MAPSRVPLYRRNPEQKVGTTNPWRGTLNGGEEARFLPILKGSLTTLVLSYYQVEFT
ncbi:hypothetical protein HS1genome_1055 [Sulfodiicoccus acidiphilus]|uniref:Uncharacterized protein n=1 Tax=Sulfodiicoccus acidiphilus TaxID=1670455 RepID=A0A348B3B4_9CREN|nr:hypothetical protein HS1genome_1055 [Sulfodiicoccus acidiphilus]GGT95608.1 hypothetical protein GCM10007116_11500 [Sulfodiicoccus acidiphilus]